MIPYIYLIIFLGLSLIGLAFWFKEYAISAMGSMLIIAIGIYIIINGVTSIDNFLTRTFGIVLIGVGAYILIRGGIEAASA